MGSRFVITANHTGAGKTLASALIALGSGADYWKPIQAGITEETDTEFVQRVTEGMVRPHPEAYRLREPRSPHAAADAEGITIHPATLLPPETTKPLIIEGAGGLNVPINRDFLFADLLEQWQFPVILVIHTYLGAINHSLLTAEALHRRNIPVAGVVINDGGYPEGEEVILRSTRYAKLGHIPQMNKVDSHSLLQVWEREFKPCKALIESLSST